MLKPFAYSVKSLESSPPSSKIISSVEEAYLLGIRNRRSNSITVKIAEPLTRLRENYGQLIPREHLEREGMTTNKS